MIRTLACRTAFAPTGYVASSVLLALLALAPSVGATGAVTYFRSPTVAASFAKGGVLFDRGTNYMIHTSRRTAPGMVEVHEKDTDLIYVMEGSALFVTGGTMVGGKTISSGEIRGTDVTGGESRLLSPGDVIIVPNGVPHWFKQVQGPLLYYTIKVR
jgi:mannose-6-phosphate isomerase-like protein (cupin superfamily)